MHEDKDGFKESTRERIAIFPSIVTRAEEHLGVKADATCELGKKYPDAKHKSITVSLVKVFVNFEEDELKVDKMAPKYERLGNGVECPEKVELILEKCKEMGTTNDTNGRLLWDVLDSFKYIGYQKPVIRDVIMESPSISNYEKVNNYCKLANDTMLTYCAILNSKVVESKKLRDRVLGYLTDAASQIKVNLGEVLWY
ncbi:unnamed protein product, partial [Medioppia subpectinata]